MTVNRQQLGTLWVANTTNQNHDFAYRFPGDPTCRQESIRPGSQIAVGGKLPLEVIASIVKDKERYGMQDANTMSTLHGFVGIAFRIDRPVPLETLLEVLEKNPEETDRHAASRREDQAAAMAANLQSRVAETGANLTHLEVEVNQAGSGEDGFGEGTEVTSLGSQSRRGARRGERMTRRSAVA